MDDKNNTFSKILGEVLAIFLAAGLFGYAAYNMFMSFLRSDTIAWIAAIIAVICTLFYGIIKIYKEENEPSKTSKEKDGCAKYLGILALVAFLDLLSDSVSKKRK